jgi:hypothetical protein
MRRLFAVAALVTLTACAGEKAAPATPASDRATVAPAADSTMARPVDSLGRRADSVMARDTARQM